MCSRSVAPPSRISLQQWRPYRIFVCPVWLLPLRSRAVCIWLKLPRCCPRTTDDIIGAFFFLIVIGKMSCFSECIVANTAVMVGPKHLITSYHTILGVSVRVIIMMQRHSIANRSADWVKFPMPQNLRVKRLMDNNLRAVLCSCCINSYAC